MAVEFGAETVNIKDLRPHPRNYRGHPADQLNHIMESIKEHGFYRNIVIAKDGTILAGHGVVQAAAKMGIDTVPVIRLDVEPNEARALKVLAGDNEIGKLGEIDDRALSEILKEIKDFDLDGLLGTGYDEMMLANLVMVTRPASEIADFDEAAAWVGMPDYEDGDTQKIKVIISFPDEDSREKFVDSIQLRIDKKQKEAWSTRWPFTERTDTASIRFIG
jgi:hypothetical protein